MSAQSRNRRQQLLQRILPGLLVSVVYFAFVGQQLGAKLAADEADLQRMKQQYIAGQGKLNELGRQRNDLLAELARLRQQGSKTEAETARYIGFLGASEYAGRAIGRLNEVLAQHGLHVIEDGRQDWNAAKESIPATLYDLNGTTAGKPQANRAGASVWRIRFSGPYPSVYRMLDALSRDELAIIPVSLDMAPPDNGGDMEWTLQIWI